MREPGAVLKDTPRPAGTGGGDVGDHATLIETYAKLGLPQASVVAGQPLEAEVFYITRMVSVIAQRKNDDDGIVARRALIY